MGEKGVRDEAITGDGRFLYALDADAQRIYGWSVGEDGSLAPVGDADGLPETVADWRRREHHLAGISRAAARTGRPTASRPAST